MKFASPSWKRRSQCLVTMRKSRLGAAKDPIDGFRGQAVKGGDRKLKVIFAGVLNLVMADTAERLHEHHDCRNASAGDFGGIVEGPRGHSIGGTGNLTDGLLTKIEKIGVKGDRFYVPEP